MTINAIDKLYNNSYNLVYETKRSGMFNAFRESFGWLLTHLNCSVNSHLATFYKAQLISA